VSGISIEPIVWVTDDKARKVLLVMYNVIWNTGQVPQSFRESIVTVLYKSGDSRICSNYRGLCLNEHQGKLLERLILNRLLRLSKKVPECIPVSQCGFVPGRSTIQASFIDRGLASECRSRAQSLFKCYVDLTKAYDRVDRELLLKLLGRLGVPPKNANGNKGITRWRKRAG